MQHALARAWQRRGAGMRALLPLAWLYGALSALRRRLGWVAVGVWAVALATFIVTQGFPFDRGYQTLWILSGLVAASVGRTWRDVGRIFVDWVPVIVILYLYDFSRHAAEALGRPVAITPQIDAQAINLTGVAGASVSSSGSIIISNVVADANGVYRVPQAILSQLGDGDFQAILVVGGLTAGSTLTGTASVRETGLIPGSRKEYPRLRVWRSMVMVAAVQTRMCVRSPAT